MGSDLETFVINKNFPSLEGSAPLLSTEYSCIVIALLQIAKLFSYTWTMGIFLCKAVHYMQSVSAICSVVTLTAMSIER